MVFAFTLNMVFNAEMNDKQLIQSLGGPTKVAIRLGLRKAGGAQRVQNWMSRGIPAKVRLARPDLFARTDALAPEFGAAEQISPLLGTQPREHA